MATIQLIFLVPDTAKPWGSSIMRGNQLCEIAKRYLGNKFDCVTMKMPLSGTRRRHRPLKAAHQMAWMARCPRAAIYFVTKQCVEKLHPISAAILQRRARGVLFDYVDADMELVSTRGADVHLCASYAQYEYMQQRQLHDASSSVDLLLHGYDYRLRRCAPTVGPVHAVYWGSLNNTHIPAAIIDEIFVIDGAAEPIARTIEALSRYRLHYGIRAQSSESGTTIFKPFTKGANAAACGANILINRDAHDAINLLGSDYPYLLDNNSDSNILDMFEAAKQGAGGYDWVRARNAMDSMAAQLSPERTARQLENILLPLTE